MKGKIYDLKERTYAYAVSVVKFLDLLPKDGMTQTLGKQLLRSATSVGANVAEARASSSKKDFTNCYNNSLKSANESRFWFTLLVDTDKASKEAVAPLLQETNELANILATSILTLKGKRHISPLLSCCLGFALCFLCITFAF